MPTLLAVCLRAAGALGSRQAVQPHWRPPPRGQRAREAGKERLRFVGSVSAAVDETHARRQLRLHRKQRSAFASDGLLAIVS